MKEYPKHYLPVDKQIEKLQSRGMVISDEGKAERYLRHIGYYPLSAYWRIARIKSANGEFTDDFVTGTNFDEYLSLYIFDKKLRLLCMDALGRIENTLKTSIVLQIGEDSEGNDNKYAHLKPETFDRKFTKREAKYSCLNKEILLPHLPLFLLNKRSSYDQWLSNHKKSLKRAQSTDSIKHIKKEYGADCEIPIWVIVNSWDMDAARTIMAGLKTVDRECVATSMGLINNNGNIIVSWFRTLCEVRNICAHHGRLWNRNLRKQPGLGKSGSYPALDLIRQNSANTHKIYVGLTIIQIMLNHISPNSLWKQRLSDILINDAPTLSNGLNIETIMGFPNNWRNQPFWK